MAQEQTFRSPGYYNTETDLSNNQPSPPIGVPAGIIGTAKKGPAFVPYTVGNFDEFKLVFGGLDTKKYGPYAANEWLKHAGSLTYLRVLGAGSNETSAEISSTLSTGRVKNAGFKLEGVAATHDSRGRHNGAVQFICGRHTLTAQEALGMPMFTYNDSFAGSNVNLVHGVVLMANGARLMVLDGNESSVGKFTASGPDDVGAISGGKFKLVISSTLGNTFANTDGNAGVKILTASFDPSSNDYFGKLLNRDPENFVRNQHLLYLDFPVDAELCTPSVAAVLSGSNNTTSTGGETTTEFRKLFGAYDTRYTSPQSSWFISQPFGNVEYDLFKFESLDDGEYANRLYKISITNLKASIDDAYQYGTFTVQVRDWNDSDTSANILESFNNCSLDPNAENYVGKVIGDKKVFYNFDAENDDERRIISSGKYENNSRLVRIVMHDNVENENIPVKTLPFGFRGFEVIKTNDALTDVPGTNLRLTGVVTDAASMLTGSIVPPVPFRFKVTRGDIPVTATWPGEPGAAEVANSSYYWGPKFERNTTPLNSNTVAEKNSYFDSLVKFQGIKLLDTLVTGSGADTFNNNKFSLSKVALSNSSVSDLTSSVANHMKEAAYIRDAKLDSSEYTVNDGVLTNRITLATILTKATPSEFNRFSAYAKFTNVLAGGYDGLNILDVNNARMNDKSTSFDALGGAEVSYVSPGLASNVNGTNQENSNVMSYKSAINIMTDPMTVNINVLAIPGIKESFITDYAATKVKDYGMAFYVMDIPSYDDSATRLYGLTTDKADPDQTANIFDGRAYDNNYVGTYWPNVYIEDLTNKRRVNVPASVAALGAISFNDKISYPWYAPAGFNRASLDFVSNVEVRLNVSDRDRLNDSRINPIATFPKLGYVIFSQKNLQLNRSALDRVNVRRMVIEVKRTIKDVAKGIVFEQNSAELRNRFTADANAKLALIQLQSGIDGFKVVMNETNNTQEDINLNKVNGKVIVIPTKFIETIVIDFVIVNNNFVFTS